MSEQERIQRTKATRDRDDVVDVRAESSRGDQLKADLDDLLDEIDDVLEENAEEFVRSYIQKGGQ